MSTPVSYAIGELVEASGFDRRTIVYYIQQGILPRVGRRGPGTRYPAECLFRLRFVKGIKELQNTGRLLDASLRDMARVLATTPPERIQALVEAGLPAAEIEPLFARRPAPAVYAAPSTAPPVAAPSPLQQQRPDAPAYRAPTGEKRSYGLADAGIRRQPPDARPAPPPMAAQAAAQPATGEAAPLPADRGPPSGSADAGGSGVAPGGAGAPEGDTDLGELLRQLEMRAAMTRRRAGPGASEHWTEIPVTARVYLSVRGLAEEDVVMAEAVARVLKRAIRGQ